MSWAENKLYETITAAHGNNSTVLCVKVTIEINKTQPFSSSYGS